MKLTEKMKKNLAILGGVLIGIGLIAAIGMQFGSKPSGKDVLPGTGETETELIVDPGDFEKKEEESKVVSREEESLVIHHFGIPCDFYQFLIYFFFIQIIKGCCALLQSGNFHVADIVNIPVEFTCNGNLHHQKWNSDNKQRN